MSDVKDMLGIPTAPPAPEQPPPPSVDPKTTNNIADDTAKKKKSKTPRELLGLRDSCGFDGATAIAPEPALLFKDKRKAAVSWKFLPIVSSARITVDGKTNDIDLNHWVKIHNVPDYRFARFNKPIKLVTYTDDEYNDYLQEPYWTRKQTDRLFQLCRQFDLRFIVIHDSFTSPSSTDTNGIAALKEEEEAPTIEGIIMSKNKTVEDLKDRYYNASRKILKARNASDPDLAKNALFTITYDPEYESQRKNQLSSLFSRTTNSVMLQAELVAEERLLRNQLQLLKAQEKHKNKGDRKRKRGNELAPIPESCIAKKLIRDRPSGVYLRSTVLTTPINLSGRQSNKQLETEMIALGIKKTKPYNVPTNVVCNLFEKVRTDLVTLINLQRLVTKKELERDALAATALPSDKKRNKERA